ncbi:MAG: hypothetical protein N2Z57_01640 [Oscillospiraceae bacterium]|nr:hypothetical protein [Oscillospiraceae bacterium]
MFTLLNKFKPFIILLCTLFLSACGASSEISTFLKTFSLDAHAQDLNITEVYNSYKGFPYEGEALYTISPAQNISPILNDWNDLPLSDDLKLFLYDNSIGEGSKADKIGLPNVTSGKWKFVDRGNANFGSLSSYNFSLCIFDKQNNVIYYYKIDT